jgi:hypothetical protein
MRGMLDSHSPGGIAGALTGIGLSLTHVIPTAEEAR